MPKTIQKQMADIEWDIGLLQGKIDLEPSAIKTIKMAKLRSKLKALNSRLSIPERMARAFMHGAVKIANILGPKETSVHASYALRPGGRKWVFEE